MKNLCFMLLLVIIIGCSTDSGNRIDNKIDCYYFIDDWYGNTGNEIFYGGKNIVQIVFLDFINSNKIEIEIFRTMTGFGQMILEKTIAEKKEKKYEFAFIDGWGNKAYGNFIFNADSTVTFYLNCKEFTDEGKIIGRLYCDTYILKQAKTEINWESIK